MQDQLQESQIYKVTIIASNETQEECQALDEIIQRLNISLLAKINQSLMVHQWNIDERSHQVRNLYDPSKNVTELEESDIVIGIFWKRFGKPSQDAKFDIEDIFRLLHDTSKQEGRPYVSIYFSKKSYSPSSERDLYNQSRIENFQKDFLQSSFWWSYGSELEFEQLLRTHLTLVIQNYLQTDSIDLNLKALSPIAVRSRKQQVEDLIHKLKDRNGSVRLQTVDALSKMDGDSRISVALTEALKDKDSSIRAEAARALGKVGGEDAIAALVLSLKNKEESFYVRARAAYSLGQIGGERVLMALAEVLKDEDPSIRIKIISALEKIGGERAIDLLANSLKDGNSEVRLEAAEALGNIAGSPNSVAVVKTLALMPVIEASKDESSDVRIKTADILGRVGGELALSVLIQKLRDGNSFVRARACHNLGKIRGEQALMALIQTLKDTDSYVRTSAANALSRIDDERTLFALIEALKDDEMSVRMAAANALIEFNTPKNAQKTVPVLIKVLQDFGREKALEETRAFIVHEVKSALGPLQSMTKSLRREVTEPQIDKEEIIDLTRQILNQTEEAFRVVNHYLSYTKPLEPELQSLDLNNLVIDLINEITPECKANDINIVQKLNPQAVSSIDPILFTQALRNIFMNAVEAIGHDGTLTIALQKLEREILIRISDTGPGIAQEFQDKVFNFGFTTKKGKQGAGLGLAWVRRIIDGHRGQIHIKNKLNEKGVTVTISLPLEDRN